VDHVTSYAENFGHGFAGNVVKCIPGYFYKDVFVAGISGETLEKQKLKHFMRLIA